MQANELENLNLEVIKDEFNKLVKLYSQIESVQDQIKLIKDSLKEEGANPALICKIAQAVVNDKREDIVNQANLLIGMSEVLS